MPGGTLFQFQLSYGTNTALSHLGELIQNTQNDMHADKQLLQPVAPRRASGK